MRFSSRVIAGSLLGLLLASAGTLPGTAQTNAPSAIDFGDDSSPWAKDGECDDPRFEGSGMADEVVDADLLKDATDCSTAFDAGTAILKAEEGTERPPAPTATQAAPPPPLPRAEIDFGDDSSKWANDGECDDPRFAGAGAAVELVDEDRLKDATDCRTAYEAGTVTFGDDADIAFGDDSSEWARDGECDDPRFVGTGVARETLAADIRRDASDCRAAVAAGTAQFQGEKNAMAFDFGSDFSRWANDGECDDLRFEGAGVDKKLLAEDTMGDATDCETLLEQGSVSIRLVYTPEYAAGAPYDSTGIDFGDNSSSYANDDECDDPRFEGPGTATTLLDGDRLADADDCKAAYENGTILIRDGQTDISSPTVTAPTVSMPTESAPDSGQTSAELADINFGDDSSDWANDGECDDPRFQGRGMARQLSNENIMKDATDCRAAIASGTVTYQGEVSAGSTIAPERTDAIVGAIDGLSAEAEKVITALLSGDGRNLSADNMMFIGGLAAGLTDHCRVFEDLGKMSALTVFATQTASNAALGGNYSADLGDIWGNQASAMSIYGLGAQAGKAVPCQVGVADTIANAILEVASGSAGAQDSAFLRSCEAGVLNSSQCSCLAQNAISVNPNIHSQSYSQSLVYGIIQTNPFLAMQIMGQCGIMRY